ncbi:MAG: PQQ-binding-like beta-propeller repeat protein [Alphaproteobacteria bacterium]|nr:PQQ-binding-like beta-propeller repeat protein [Alphaproteobacteria bacterium]
MQQPSLPGAASVAGFSADPAHRGVVAGEIGTTLANLWVQPLAIQGWHSSPIVVGDRVFVSTYGKTWNECDDGDGVHVLRRDTGDKLAFLPTRCDANGLSSDGQRVFVVTDQGRAFAWTTAGDLVFDVQVGEKKLYGAPTPTYAGLVVTGADLVALLDPATGAVKTRLSETMGKVRNHSVAHGKVWFGSDSGRVGWCRLDGQGCEERFITGDRFDNYGAIALDGDQYAIAGGYDGSAVQEQLALHRVSDDGRIWGVSHAVGAKAAPVIAGDLVLFAESGEPDADGTQAWGGSLWALDRKTGEERWVVREHGGSWSTPVVVGDRIVWVPHDGTVRILALGTGEELASHALGDRVFATPAVVDGVIYVGTDGGELHAISTR